jgi:hypothetical protein
MGRGRRRLAPVLTQLTRRSILAFRSGATGYETPRTTRGSATRRSTQVTRGSMTMSGTLMGRTVTSLLANDLIPAARRHDRAGEGMIWPCMRHRTGLFTQADVAPVALVYLLKGDPRPFRPSGSPNCTGDRQPLGIQRSGGDECDMLRVRNTRSRPQAPHKCLRRRRRTAGRTMQTPHRERLATVGATRPRHWTAPPRATTVHTGDSRTYAGRERTR